MCRRELLHPLQKKGGGGGGGGGIVKSSLHKCIGVWHIIAKQIVLVCLKRKCLLLSAHFAPFFSCPQGMTIQEVEVKMLTILKQVMEEKLTAANVSVR